MVAGLVGRKADAFAALLEGNSPAAADPHLAQLANLASRLSTVPQPTAAFRSTLRDQLMATASHSATTAAPPAAAVHTAAAHAPAAHTIAHDLGSSGLATLGKTAPVWAKVFAGVAALGVSATGVAVGAQRALPGDFFYGVKKQVEAVQLDLASGAHEKAITEFGFAQARINELNTLIKREHVAAGGPVSKDTEAHIKDLLENWAENTGVATTSLIQQIQALGSSSSAAAQSQALRNQLSSFTSAQFASMGRLLGDMPTASLQSLTVSALGYLQRVDAVLGHDPASLIGKLPVSLNSVPGVSKVLPRLVLPAGIPITGGQAVLPSRSVLTSLAPSLLPKAGGLLPTGVPLITLPSTATGITLPSSGTGITLPGVGAVPNPLPSAVQSAVGAIKSAGGSVASQLPGAVQSVAGNAGKTATGAVTGVTNGVTNAASGTLGAITGGVSSSAGPSLPLPITLPVLPTLP